MEHQLFDNNEDLENQSSGFLFGGWRSSWPAEWWVSPYSLVYHSDSDVLFVAHVNKKDNNKKMYKERKNR